MANLILDERDQKFALFEMLEVDTLCEKPRYEEFSRELFDMILTETWSSRSTRFFLRWLTGLGRMQA